MNGPVCHVCPKGGTDDQIARYLSQGGVEWTKEEVSNIRGLYDTIEDTPVIPEDQEGKELSPEELVRCGELIASYKHELAIRHLKDLKDSTKHPAKSFEKLYKVDGWTGSIRSDRINMIVHEFTKVLTKRQKQLAAKGIKVTREQICNGHSVDGKKTDGQFSVFEEVFYKFYNEMKNASLRIDVQKNALDSGKISQDEYNEKTAKDRLLIEELTKVISNWGPLCSFARMRIKDREGIKLGNTFEYASATSADDFTTNEPLEEEYTLEESVREAWMTHEGEMSAFSNLGTEVRRFLSTVPVRVNGKTQTDDLGYPKFYDPITTHQYVAEKLRGYKKESDILEAFRVQIAKGTLGDPILINVGYSLLEAAGVPKTPLYDRHGVLKKDAKGNPKTGRQIPKGGKFTKENGLTNYSIITQFVTDLHANMVPFTAMIRNRNGDIVIKRLNRNVESIGLNEYLLQIKAGIPVTVEDRPGVKPVNSIFDNGGSMNVDNYTSWHDEVLRLFPPKKKKQEGQDNAEDTSGTFIFANMEVYAADDSDAGYKALRNADKLDFLIRALRCIGVNLTDEEFRILHHNLPARWKVLRNLSSLATFMEQYKGNFVAQGSGNSMSMHTLVNQTVGQVDEFGRKAKPMMKALENIFSAVDEVTGNKGVERRVSWYDRKGNACSRYSDQTPSYMGDLVDEIKTFVRNGDGKGLQDFLMMKWGSDDFFYDRNANGGKGKFRNTWLQELYDSVNKDGSISSTSFAATFEFTEFLGSNIDHKPSNFENFSEKTHAVAMLKNFVQLRDLLGERHKYADYPCFILGDAGKQRFFRAKHYSIDTILDKMVDIYDQELVRMKDAEALKRALALRGIEEKDMPEDYVKGANRFSILTFLNPDFENGKYWKIATGKDNIARIWDISYNVIEDMDKSLIEKAIKAYMEDSLSTFMDRLVDHGILEKNEHGKYVDSEGTFATSTRKLYDSSIAGFVEDFFWNTKFATIQQIQMFTVDTSFYQSVKDLQKRYKEIYAPGKGLSLEARDYEGNLYSEKSYETAVYFEDLTSFSDERPEFDETLKNGLKEDSPDYAEYNDRKKGSSITDGQGYRTLESYRAIMGMQGKWTREMESAYQKIVKLREIAKTRDSKELTADEVQQIADLQMIFQPLKPYMFTLEKVDVGEDPTDTNEPKRHKYVMVPVQHKYAEVVLIPEVMPKGKLRDMALWMQENHVDLLASTKCVKVGAYGAAKIQGKDGADLIAALNANSTVKHQLNYSDYRIQSGVPEHLNQNQLFGTQIRKLIYSGIKKDKQYGHYLRNILRQYDGEGELEVYIPGAGMQKLTGDNVINLYNSIIMADMFESYEQMEAHANTKQQLSDMLMQNGISNANQVEDVLMGYAIDDDGDFTFPIGDPTMEHDSTGLLLSILKKGVNKQKIHGGSAVQMAPMGTVEDGGLREVCSKDRKNVLYEEVEVTWNRTYIDIEGNKIPLKFSDYCFADNVGNHNIGDLLPYVDGKGNPYIIDEYITDESGEQKVNPEWEEYQSFTYKLIDGKWEPCDYREDGAKVIKPKIEVEFPGSLDMIAYRIPTERLYSTINCKVKRFSHPAAGGVLKVPVSGTTKAGFDFDIDKLYFFMKEFSQENLSPEQVEDIWNGIYKDTPGLLDALKKVHNDSVKKQKVLAEARRKGGEDLADFVKRTEYIDDVQNRMYKYWSTAAIEDAEGNRISLSEYFNCDSPTEFFRKYVEEHKKDYPTPFDNYDINKAPSDQSKIARGNMLIGIIRERLKDEETFKERYTPGGFRKLSRAALDMRFLLYGDRSEISDNGRVDLKTISKLSQEVKDKKREDPEPNYDYSDPSTILIYNQQNQIAAKLIGIFANQNTHHVFCSSLYALESNDIIAFGDHTEKGLYDFLHKDNLDRAAEIDNNMAELLAAAVDAVKDPVLNYLNLNLTTADSAAVLIRLGYSQREIGLLFNQPIIKDLCEEIDNTGVSVEVAINKVSKKYETDSVKWKGLKYNSSTTDTQQLADNILEGRRIKEEGVKEENIKDSFKENQLQVLKLFNQIQGVASEMNSFVQSTRFTAANSIGSTWGDIIAMLQRTEKFAKMYENQPIARKSKSSDNEEKDSNGPKLRILPRTPKPGETTMSVLDLSDESLNSSSKKFAEDNYGNPLGFEQCMLNLVRKAKNLFGVHYPHFTTLYTEIRNQLTNMTKHGTLDGNTINSIHRDLMDFLLIANSAYSDFDGDATIRQNPNILSARLTDNENIPNRIFYRKEFPEIIGRVITARDKLPVIHKSPFFSRLQQTRDGSAVYVKGVGGMQSLTSNDIVEAWMDAIESNETITIDKWDNEGNPVLDQNNNPIKITYAVRDLAIGMFFHNFYRLGFNFHGTSTMHLTPIRLKQMLNVTGLASGNGSYVDFVRRVIRGEVSWDESGTVEANAINRKLVNLFVEQYILNHLDNYRFTFNVRKTSPVGKFLFEKSGLKDGKPAKEFFLDQSEIEEKGYDNLLTVDGNVGDENMMYKPALCLQVSDTVKYYYIADSGSSTEFNVASRSEGGIRYVRVNPLGVKGQLINYFDSETRLKKFQDSLTDNGDIPFLRELKRTFRISRGGLQQEINHMLGMGIKVHTLREMEIFMEQHPELFDGRSVEDIAKQLADRISNEDTLIAKRLHEATVIWGHPGMGKTHFFKNGGDKEVIDFDTVYKSRINKELNLPEGPEARKQWRREHRAEYKQKLFDLFDEAIADAKRTGKKLLVSDMAILRERESDLDVITQMTEDNFAQRSEQRNEPYDANKKLWKQDIDEAMANVSDRNKIVLTDAYFSDLYNIEFLKTPSGEVYGFVYQGEIYMDETKLDPQVPIHEYTHIWDEAVMQSNPRLWERGKRLLRDSRNSVLRNLWNEIAESDSYGKKWQAQGKTEEEIENLITGEVHARLVGEKGAELLEQIEKAEGGKGLVARLKRWMKDVFKHLAKTFGTWTDKALSELTLEDFINMPLRDFLDGTNPNVYSMNSENFDANTLVIGEKGAAAFDAAEEASVRMDNLAAATEMENSGNDALTIKQATGWERGADGKWRYEEMDLQINKEWFDKVKSMELSERRELSFKLKDIVDSNEISKLIQLYPLIASLTITVANKNLFDILQSTRGSYNPETNTLMLNFSRAFLGDDVTIESIRSTLMHEIQHLIQTEEGFAEGGNTRVVEDRPEMKKLMQLSDTLKSKEDQLFAEENQDNIELINKVETFGEYTEEYKRWEDEQNRRSEINELRRKHNRKVNEKRSELILKLALEYNELADVKFSAFDKMFHKSKIKEHEAALKKLNEAHEKQLEEFDKANPKQPLLRQEYFFDGPTYNGSKYSFEEKDAMREQVRELRLQWKRNSEKYKTLQKEISEIQDEIDKTRYNLYSRIAGEVESRAAERRLNLSPEERRNTLFTDEMYKDVAQEDLIFMDENLQGTQSDNLNEEYEVTNNYSDMSQPEFNQDDITYEETRKKSTPADAYTDDEWNDMFDALIDRNPLMAKCAERGLFDRQALKQMFMKSERTSQLILEEIKRGLDDGSIKPMTIDENSELIPVCM